MAIRDNLDDINATPNVKVDRSALFHDGGDTL